MDNVSVFFLAEGEQRADEVMVRLTTFIRAAKQTLDFAIYDMRFSDPLKTSLSSALRERAEAGVKIRFCYDADKPFPPNVAAGQDPAPSGTGAFVQSLGYPWRRIAGMKLMHSKFILRDGQTVWTGSANMTDDAFTLMENNVVEIDSQALANYYAEDFEQLWEKENFENTGEIHTKPVPVSFAGQPAQVRVMFSPGCGLEIDSEIARRVRAAQRRVRICSLLINSGTLIGELGNLMRKGAPPWTASTIARKWTRFMCSGRKCRKTDGKSPRSKRSSLAQVDWEKLNTLLGARAPQLHAQQSSCDRRYCDHRLL